jgi:hypothetical protein
MKIDLCLVAADNNNTFLEPWDLVRGMWKEICNIDAKLILIANEIPDYVDKDSVILFKPIEHMHTAFQAQCIRILYPCLFDNKNILISDADILPCKKEYFVDSIENIDDDKFITYRDAYIKQEMYGICYNIANSNTWKKVFNIKTEDDIRNMLKIWYNHNYTGRKNCSGWYTDQKMLFKYLQDFPDHIILKDKELHFSRLDKRQRNFIARIDKQLIENIKNKRYTDFHFIRPYSRYYKTIIKICDYIKVYNSYLHTAQIDEK